MEWGSRIRRICGNAVEAALEAATIPETAEQFGVSISSVVRFRRLHRETGSVSRPNSAVTRDMRWRRTRTLVRQLVAEQPDITLAEIKADSGDGESDGRSVVDLPISASFEVAL